MDIVGIWRGHSERNSISLTKSILARDLHSFRENVTYVTIQKYLWSILQVSKAADPPSKPRRPFDYDEVPFSLF